jgi:hypothetical protein
VHEFSVNLHEPPPIPVDQEVIVTGIGQILAVPS